MAGILKKCCVDIGVGSWIFKKHEILYKVTIPA